MKTTPPKRTAEARVVKKYHKLYAPLVELVHALQDLEPGGTLISHAEFTQMDKSVRVEYRATPALLVINADNCKFTLNVEELSADSHPKPQG